MPSAVIRFHRYDEPTQRLLVVFQTGRKYVYVGVPPTVAAAFRRAFSKGEYFNAHIRDRFAFARVEDESAAATATPTDGPALRVRS